MSRARTVVCLLMFSVTWCGADAEDEPLLASAYFGLGVDSFAAQEHARYLNPDESGDIQTRFAGGIDFAYRLFGGSDSTHQLWILGETIYGVRSTDVDCADDATLSICEDNGFDPNTAGSTTLAIVRNASSLEAFVGVRWEFVELQGESLSPAHLYLTARTGFLTVTGDDDDLVDTNHVGFGLIASEGRYAGSYLEAGYGTSHIFEDDPHGRYKLDGFLSWEAGFFKKLGAWPFVQFVADVDLKEGPDTVQTYFGFDFDLDLLFGASL